MHAALEADPRGVWTAKLRLELATVELAAGRFAAAEELARAEAVALLADDRKDRLAEVYHAFARRLLEPDDPIVKPDPNAAYELLVPAATWPRARRSARGSCSRWAAPARPPGNFPRAIENFQAYAREYPAGADRSAARYHLGEAQLSAGNALAARLTWTDLARDLDLRPVDSPRSPDDAPIRAAPSTRSPGPTACPSPPTTPA